MEAYYGNGIPVGVACASLVCFVDVESANFCVQPESPASTGTASRQTAAFLVNVTQVCFIISSIPDFAKIISRADISDKDMPTVSSCP